MCVAVIMTMLIMMVIIVMRIIIVDYKLKMQHGILGVGWPGGRSAEQT